MRCKVSAIEIKKLLFELHFNLEAWWADDSWNANMIDALVDDAESWLLSGALLVQRNDLHDITVADSHGRGMS